MEPEVQATLDNIIPMRFAGTLTTPFLINNIEVLSNSVTCLDISLPGKSIGITRKWNQRYKLP